MILGITQEAVVPGKMPAFLKTRAAATEALRPVAGGQIAVGLVSVSGPEEVWTFNFHQHLADIEATRLAVEKLPATRAALDRLDEQAGVCLSHRQTQTATYLPDLTYQPGFDWAQARYLDIIVVHVRAGHHLAYLELRRMSRDGHNKGGLDGPLHVFKLNSGVRGLAWMIVRPLRSLQQYDELKAQGFGEILTPQEDARMEALRAESMEDAEERFFRVEPAISLVPTAWIARDPAFWAPVAR
ncbi:MAG: hypothetical protein ABI222_18175 [Opitutaceae bacterium]